MFNPANRIVSFQASASRGAGLAGRLLRLWHHYRAAREHRRAMAHLLGQEARLLNDIGIDRATVLGHYLTPWQATADEQTRR